MLVHTKKNTKLSLPNEGTMLVFHNMCALLVLLNGNTMTKPPKSTLLECTSK
jgi:hypothetical protein